MLKRKKSKQSKVSKRLGDGISSEGADCIRRATQAKCSQTNRHTACAGLKSRKSNGLVGEHRICIEQVAQGSTRHLFPLSDLDADPTSQRRFAPPMPSEPVKLSNPRIANIRINSNVIVAAFFRACPNHVVAGEAIRANERPIRPAVPRWGAALHIHRELTTVQVCSRLSMAHSPQMQGPHQTRRIVSR